MAKKYSLRVTNELYLLDIKTALENNNLIDQVLFSDASNFIFTLTFAPGKFFKINKMENLHYLQTYFGDNWVSGSALIGETRFGNQNTNYNGVIVNAEIIVGEDYFIILATSDSSMSSIIYFGKFTNNNIFCFSLNVSGETTTNAYNLTDSKYMTPLCLSNTLKNNGHILTIPSFWGGVIDNEIEMAGAIPAEVKGVKVAAYNLLNTSVFDSGDGFILTPSNMRLNKTNILGCSFLMEYTVS